MSAYCMIMGRYLLREGIINRESFRHVGHAFTIAEGLETSLDLLRHNRMQPIQNAWSQPAEIK